MYEHHPIPPVPETVCTEIQYIFSRADTLAGYLHSKVHDFLIDAVPRERRNSSVQKVKAPNFLSPEVHSEVIRIAFHLSLAYSHPGALKLFSETAIC